MTAGYQHFKENTASTFRVEQFSILKSVPRRFSRLQFHGHKNMLYTECFSQLLSILV